MCSRLRKIINVYNDSAKAKLGTVDGAVRVIYAAPLCTGSAVRTAQQALATRNIFTPLKNVWDDAVKTGNYKKSKYSRDSIKLCMKMWVSQQSVLLLLAGSDYCEESGC